MPRRRRRNLGADFVKIAEEARESERTDIARELHDTVIQPLAALVTSMEAFTLHASPPGVTEAYIAGWRELTQEAIVALRCALGGLRTHAHAELGLPEALHRYVAPQARAQGIRLTLESRDWADDLPLDLTSSLYLLVREALTNVQKHARATEVTILLRADETHVAIIITDNGVGFHADKVDTVITSERRTGFGLVGMRERVDLLGGCFTVASASGQGTRVEISVPRPLKVADTPFFEEASPLQALEADSAMQREPAGYVH